MYLRREGVIYGQVVVFDLCNWKCTRVEIDCFHKIFHVSREGLLFEMLGAAKSGDSKSWKVSNTCGYNLRAYYVVC